MVVEVAAVQAAFVASDLGCECWCPARWAASEAEFESGGGLEFGGGPDGEFGVVASEADIGPADSASAVTAVAAIGHFAVEIGFVGCGAVGQVEFAAGLEMARG